MKYEVREESHEWIVEHEGVEVGRFTGQDDALAEVAERLRGRKEQPGSYSLAVRYQPRD